MSDTEYMSIKEVITEMREEQKAEHKETLDKMSAMSLLIVGDYAKKVDCDKCKVENSNTHNLIMGWLIGAYVFILSVAGFVITVFQAKGGK